MELSAGLGCWLLSGVEGLALLAEVDLVLPDRASGLALRVRADLVLLGPLEGMSSWEAEGPGLPDPAGGFAPRLERVAEGLGLLEKLGLVSDSNLTLFRDREERRIGPVGVGSGLGAALR